MSLTMEENSLLKMMDSLVEASPTVETIHLYPGQKRTFRAILKKVIEGSAPGTALDVKRRTYRGKKVMT